MHLGPWSSAKSHSLGQPICLSTSTTLDMSALPSSLRSRSLDRMTFLISRGRGQVSASCWSIAEVKLEWKYCSKSWHSRTKQIESTSSDKDANYAGLSRVPNKLCGIVTCSEHWLSKLRLWQRTLAFCLISSGVPGSA